MSLAEPTAHRLQVIQHSQKLLTALAQSHAALDAPRHIQPHQPTNQRTHLKKRIAPVRNIRIHRLQISIHKATQISTRQKELKHVALLGILQQLNLIQHTRKRVLLILSLLTTTILIRITFRHKTISHTALRQKPIYARNHRNTRAIHIQTNTLLLLLAIGLPRRLHRRHRLHAQQQNTGT